MQLDEDFVFINHEETMESLPTQEEYLSEISKFVDDISDELWTVNKTIHDNPELAYKEFIAHETLTKFMASRPGWKVTPSAYGFETAWIAVFDSGKKGPVVSINVEMDALEGIGHACGHNLIATASVAAGLATAEILNRHNLAGQVVVIGTPAEEGGAGKIKLLEAGVYKDLKADVSLCSHPTNTPNVAYMRTSAYTAFRVEYFGREAHAAASPWEGINALDALITAYNAISVLRQQTMPGDVIQGNISDGGVRPNIIHGYAAGNFIVRANTQARLVELTKKVNACFEAGAIATGATFKITLGEAYADHVPNRVLTDRYRGYFNQLNPPEPIPNNPELEEITGRTNASTDQGNISHAMPSLNPGFRIPTGPEGAGPHNPKFEKAAGTREAFEACLRCGKGMAAVGVDILRDLDLLERVKKQWEEDMRQAAVKV